MQRVTYTDSRRIRGCLAGVSRCFAAVSRVSHCLSRVFRGCFAGFTNGVSRVSRVFRRCLAVFRIISRRITTSSPKVTQKSNQNMPFEHDCASLKDSRSLSGCVSRVFRGVSRVFRSVSRVFRGFRTGCLACFAGVSRVFHAVSQLIRAVNPCR